MKVLFLVNIPSPYRVNFFNELSKNCDLTVAFEKKNSKARDSKWISDEGINFRAVFLDGIRIKNRLVYSRELVDLAKQDWDIVVLGVYMITPAIYINRLYSRKHKPFYIQADGGFIKNDRWFADRFKRGLISAATGWITSGPETTKYLVHYGAVQDKCFEYPFSSIRKADIVDSFSVRKERMEQARKQLGLGQQKKIILAVGQFIHRKGFDVLLKSATKLKNEADIIFVGGVPTAEYQQLCSSLELQNVFFEGFKTKKELEKYYQAADIFVLPTREDIWGLVINEAMAYGLPVVTTDRCIAGLELIENGENGFIFKTDNVEELASRIDELLEDEELRNKISQNNIEKIAQYTIETMAAEHMKIFEKIEADKGAH